MAINSKARHDLFQFTPLREGRLVRKAQAPEYEISIHAPPRGATTVIGGITALSAFQFTPLREGRLCDISRTDNLSKFQFTPLREGRQNRIR